MKKCFLLLACVALLPFISNATILTVGAAGPPTYDYVSIQAAVNAASPGDTIRLADETFTEAVTIATPGIVLEPISGTPEIDGNEQGIPLTILADSVVIDGIEMSNSSLYGVLLQGVKHCVLKNLSVGVNSGPGIVLNLSDSNQLLENELLINFVAGIALMGSSGNFLENNDITFVFSPQPGDDAWGIVVNGVDTDTDGIDDVFSTHNVIDSSTIQSCKTGIYLGWECNHNKLGGNMVFSNAGDGIVAWKSHGHRIQDNYVMFNDSSGIQLHASQNDTLLRNIISNNNPSGVPTKAGVLIRSGHVEYAYPAVLMSTGLMINHNDISTNGGYEMRYEQNAYADDDDILIDANCNWWGSDNPFVIATLVSDNIDFLPFLISGDLWVEPDCSGQGPVVNITQDDSYLTIQDAIDEANPGDTIQAGTGTYNENVEIDVPRLVLTNASSPIIEGIGDDIVVHITADSVTLDGFTITNAGMDPAYAGVFLAGVKGVKIQNCSIVKNYSTGLALLGADSNYVLNNVIDTNYVAGVGIVASSHNTFTGNIIRANKDIAVKNGALGYGIVIDQLDLDPDNCGGDVNAKHNVFANNDVLNNDVDGIYVGESCDSNTFIGNTISGNGDNGLYLWKSGQNVVRSNTISLNENCGLQLMGSPGNEIVGNSVLDNNQSGGSENAGIKVRSGNIQVCSVWIPLISDTNVIDSNIISGNDAYGVLFEDNPGYTDDDHLMLNADLNYWGNPNGPSGPHFGTGDTVSTRVIFCPWLNAPPPAGRGMGPVFNISQQTGHCSIQDAIDAASPGDTIEVGGGPYNLISPVRITQSVYLRGIPERKSLVVVNAPTTGTDRDVFQVLADDVTIDGFQIQGAHDVSGSAMGRTNAGIAVGGDYFILGAKPAGATDFTFGSWWALSVDNTVIKNNYITNNSYGIFLFHATNATIRNNDISRNIYNGDTTTMWNGKGIQIYTSQDMTDDNLATGGTGLPHSLNILIDSNLLSQNELFGIELNHAESFNGGDDGPYDVNIVITNNDIVQNGSNDNYPWGTSDLYRGISANGNEKNVTVSGNHIYGHTPGGNFNPSCAGIRIWSSADWSITRNTIDRNFRGIYAYGTSSGINVTDSNAIFDNAQGVVMAADTTGLIKENMIYNNDELLGLSGITAYGVLNLGTGMLDASPNWWGHSSGPYHPKLNPCGLGDRVSDSVDFDPWYIDQALTKNGGVPIVSDASLISSRDLLSWEGLGGDLANGFELCLHPQQPYYYLDIQSFTVSAGLDSTDFEQNAFFLDTNNLPAGFYDYWDTVRGVDGNNNAGGWELAMWYIIQGDEPMFYIRYDNQDYDLIDGLQYELGYGENPLRINGDYPLGTYAFFGSVRDTNGSCSDTFNVEITFHPTPDVFFEVDAVPLLPYDSLVYCFDVDSILLSLVNTQFGATARGTAPFMIEFTVDNGTPIQLTGVQYEDEIDLLDYLPPGPYPGQTAAGIYEIQVTDFADAYGCGLVPEAIIYYNFKITINPQPDAFFEVDGTPLQPFDSLVYCFDVPEIILSLVDEQLGQPAIGTPPYMIEFTVDGGAPVQLTGVQYDDEIDLLDYLPPGPYPGQTAAGIYEIVVTDFADSNGCTLVPNAMAYYRFKVAINAEPSVSLSLPITQLCKNATGLLLSGGSPAGGTFSGTGVSNNAFFPALVPAGTYTITYTYQDEHNCISTATDQMTVLPLPVVNFSPIPDVCEDQAYLILNQGSPAGGTYGGAYMKGDTFDVAAAGPGTYNLTYHYQDGNGCINWKAQSITVHPLPVESCPANQEVCLDEPPFALSGATPVGGTYSGTGVNAGAFNAAQASVGNHLITYTFADSNGCVSTCSFTITVHPLPVVQCPADFSLCADAGPYTLSGASPSGGVYGGSGVTNGKFYASTAGVGNHIITYSYTDANGCTASCTFTITVHPLPVAAIQASDTELCEGECATLTASGGDSYMWSNAAATAQQQVCPTQSTTYTVTVTDVNGCSDVAQIAIVVHPAPPVDAGADQSVCLLEGAQLLASGAHSYAWSTGEHTAGIAVSPKITATYTVTGTDANGCTASDAVVVTILPLPELSIVAVDEVCYGECIILNASGAQSYSWSDGGSGSPYTYCPVNSDSITLTGTGANGCTATEVHSYTVLDLPIVDAGVDTSIFIGQSYLFDANATGVAPLSYLWSPALALDDASLLNPEATPIMTDYYVLAVTDGNGCVGSDQFLLEVKPQGNSISGQVVYGNTQQTPLEGFEVVIQSQGAKYADTVYTGPNGLFSLSNIPSGTYAIGGNSNQPWGWGGVNATDALNILLHTVELDSLIGIYFLAADIDGGGFVNSTDALNVALRFAGLPNNFAGDWIMEADTFFLDYEDLYTRQYLALVLGDVNASNVFSKTLVPNGSLLQEGSMPLPQEEAIRIPLYCKEDVLAGALSMSLRIPEGLQIEDVQLAEGVGGYLVHNVVDGQLRLAWYDVGGSLLSPGSEILQIVARNPGSASVDGFRLGSELELSDAAGKIIADAVFTMPELIAVEEGNLQLSAWPNPARDAMQIRYDLPVDGKVVLKIYDARGALVRVVEEAAQAAGSHTIALDVSNLAAGSYVAELTLESDGSSLTARQKLVVLR